MCTESGLWSQAERGSHLDSAPYLWVPGKVFPLSASAPHL